MPDWVGTLKHHAAHPDPISLHCAVPASLLEHAADTLASLSRRLDLARNEAAHWEARAGELDAECKRLRARLDALRGEAATEEAAVALYIRSDDADEDDWEERGTSLRNEYLAKARAAIDAAIDAAITRTEEDAV